jgi:LysR family transcriptional regulator, regulator for bpeEF and oprC
VKDLNNIAVFVKAAEARNFTDASRGLGITSSSVSKIITRLEAELGVRLFNRSTRSVNLTHAGVSFLERCKEALEEVADAEHDLREVGGSLKGKIRITMPVGVGRRLIAPALPAFTARYSEIVVEAELSDRVVDLNYEPVDIAVVRGAIADPKMIARNLFTLDFVACASPEYIAKFGEPTDPNQLAEHHCLAYMGPQMSRYREWDFMCDERVLSLPVSGRLNMNSAESLLDAAVSGLGIVMLSTMYTADAIQNGKLKMILTDFAPPSTVVSAVCLPNRSLSARIGAFMEMLAELTPPVSLETLRQATRD